MATLQTYIDQQPKLLRNRYVQTPSLWVSWANQILERLALEDLIPDIKTECGLLVTDEIYLDIPAGYRKGISLTDPLDSTHDYYYEEITVEGVTKLRLTDETIPDDIAIVDYSAITAQSVLSFEVDHIGVDENEYEDCLFVVTAGTLKGKTYIIDRNDASGLTTTKLYLRHPLASAWTAPQVTAASLYGEESYLVLKYESSPAVMALATEEVPLRNIDEANIMATGLRFFSEQRTPTDMNNVNSCSALYEQAIANIKGSIRSKNGKMNVRPRRIIGLQ